MSLGQMGRSKTVHSLSLNTMHWIRKGFLKELLGTQQHTLIDVSNRLLTCVFQCPSGTGDHLSAHQLPEMCPFLDDKTEKL